MGKASGNKVEWYAVGTITIDVPFPNGEVACKYCPFVRDENRGLRFRCTAPTSQEILYAPDKDIGIRCPLKISYPAGHETEGQDEQIPLSPF